MEPTQEEFEAIFAVRRWGRWPGSYSRSIVRGWPPEIAKIKTPKDIAPINSTPRAQQFWLAAGLVCAVPVVLIVMFLLTR